jgi:predicted permease
MLGHATMPMMLVSPGYRLHDFHCARPFWAFVRIVGGFLIASMVVHLIDAEGVNRQVLLLSSALRPAVINFVLTEKYGKDPDLAASIVVLNTLLSILSIPLLFWMIL